MLGMSYTWNSQQFTTWGDKTVGRCRRDGI